MNEIPTYNEIVALHKKYAPSQEAFDFIFSHSQIVWEIAQQLINKSDLAVDPELVKAGCLLHDIGIYNLYLPNGQIDGANYIKHGVEGHRLLKQEDFDEQLCRFASHHTGLAKQDIERDSIPIPSIDYLAETPEEQLVMYADKFHTKKFPPKFVTADTCAQKLGKFGKEKAELFRRFQKKFSTPNIELLAKKYNSEII